MDPVSIIGTTSAILSFIEAGTKFIDLTRELYKSSSGLSKEVDEMNRLYSEVESVALHLQTNAAGQTPATNAQRSLAVASEHCLKACADVQSLIDQLTVSKTGSRTRSLAAAAKVLLKKSEIESLQNKVERAQQLLSSASLAVIRQVAELSLSFIPMLIYPLQRRDTAESTITSKCRL
jgi:hypothetical protein